MATLGKHGQAAMDIDAGREIGTFRTIRLQAHVADPYSGHAFVLVIE